jgi:hypothetical protein
MNKQVTFIKVLALSAIAVGSMNTANAAIFFRTRVVVAPVAVAPVAVAPVVAAPVVAAPVVAAPVVAAPAPAAVVAAPVAPVVVAPVVVPTCRLVSVPVVNAFTGVTYLVPRRVCN